MDSRFRIGSWLVILFIGTALSPGAEPPPESLPWSFSHPSEGREAPPEPGTDLSQEVDRLIAARLQEKGLDPAPRADRRTLIRRAALDLTGLPPSPEEIESFLADSDPDPVAFSRVVDHYLASPRFGERWGRHWLDVARYADSVGRTWNAPFVYAWKYRDWVIDAFNEDKSYRRFIAEQIAGDLLPADSIAQRREQVIGTGFLTLGSLSINQGQGLPVRLYLHCHQGAGRTAVSMT